MNLLSLLEGPVMRSLRLRVETMEVLVKVVQRDAKVSEMRARRHAYPASAQFRLGKNGCPFAEPKSV